MKWIKTYSFKKRIALTYSLLMIPIFAILVVNIYDLSIAAAYKQRTSAAISIMKNETDNIENSIGKIETSGFSIISNKTVSTYINTYFLNAGDKIVYIINELQPFIDWTLQSNKGILFDIKIYTSNQKISDYYLFNYYNELPVTQWFDQVENQIDTTPDLWLDLHDTAGKDKFELKKGRVYSLFLNITPTVRTTENYILEMQVEPEYLFPFLKKSPGPGDTRMLLLSDGLGLVESNGPEDDAIGRYVLDHGLAPDVTHNISIKGAEYIVQVHPIQKLSSSLVLVVPMDGTKRALLSDQIRFVLVCLLLASLVVGVSYFFADRLSRRLNNIVIAVKKIQREDFDVHLEVAQQDEVGELATDINIMSQKINSLISNVYKASLAQKDAEILSLQAQINPHFIYNTLETIKMIALSKDDFVTSDSLTALGGMLRYNVSNRSQSRLVLLDDEMAHVSDYLYLQNILLNDRLALKTEIQPRLLQATVLRHMLQPIIENSITHGFVNVTHSLEILIRAEPSDDFLFIDICDNGCAPSDEEIEMINRRLLENGSGIVIGNDQGNGIALANIHLRIQLAFGIEYGLLLSRSDLGGMNTRCRLPLLFNQVHVPENEEGDVRDV